MSNVISSFVGIFLVMLVVAAYLAPTVVGAIRKVVNIGSVAAINLLLGWTLIGWAVALAMALRTNPPGAGPPSPRLAVSARSGGPRPGWYADPSGTQRWWDGQQWTSATQDPVPPGYATRAGARAGTEGRELRGSGSAGEQ